MLTLRRTSALLIAVTLAASLSACGDGSATEPAPPAAQIATVSVTAVTSALAPGQSTQLAATASTADGQVVTDAAFTWLSEAPAVAMVNAAGRVTALGSGTAVLAATAGTVRGTVTITVRAAVASLTLEPGTADVFVGSTIPITAQVRDSANTVLTGRTITWTTDNAAVASVSGAGVVTGTSTGVATITASCEGHTATARVTVSKRSLSSIVDSVRIAWSMPAMGGAIVTLEDGVTAIAVAGTRRAAGGAMVTTEDLWHLGSNVKAMTSMLAAVAVSQDRIQWTTTVAQAFPELADIRAEYREVTLRELLSHQSGMLRSIALSALGSVATAPAQRASIVAWAVEQPPVTSRGTYWYSNVGYVMAAAMLERAFGTSYEAAMAAHVHAPLGMTDAGWGPQAAAGSTAQPVAHNWVNGNWNALEGFDSPPGSAGAGYAHMSLTSWGRFIHEMLRVEAGAATIANTVVARQTTSEQVNAGFGTSYGMGWLISASSWAGGRMVQHDGTNLGNHSITYLAPLRNVAFLATTNGFDPSGRSAQAVDALIGRLVIYYGTGQ